MRTMIQSSLKMGHQILHCPISSGASEGASERSKRAVRQKQTSERCERTSERTSEWPIYHTRRFHIISTHCAPRMATPRALRRDSQGRSCFSRAEMKRHDGELQKRDLEVLDEIISKSGLAINASAFEQGRIYGIRCVHACTDSSFGRK